MSTSVCTKFGAQLGNTVTYFQNGLDACATFPSLGLTVLHLYFNQQSVPEATVYATLRAHLQNKNFATICNSNSDLQEIRLYFKYQMNTGTKGWTLEDLPLAHMQRCAGNVRLPLS